MKCSGILLIFELFNIENTYNARLATMIIIYDIHNAVYLGINFHFIFGPNTTTRDYTAKVKSSLVFIN
jgi:hypothetical protein